MAIAFGNTFARDLQGPRVDHQQLSLGNDLSQLTIKFAKLGRNSVMAVPSFEQNKNEGHA
jgi:hypothetical protein